MKVAIYCRVSTEEQKADLQLDDIRNFCKFKKWNDTTEFVDHGQSGSKESRPALDDMMKRVRAGEFGAVVVWKFDRLGRSTAHLVKLVEEFKELGVNFVSVQESVDTTSAMGKMVFTIFAALAEFEKQVLITRVKAGMEAARKRGKHVGRARSIDRDALSALLAEGLTPKRIAAILDIHPATVRKIIRKEKLVA